MAIRSYDNATQTWSTWKHIAYDIPDFYKNYSTLAALGTALGVDTQHIKIYGGQVAANGSVSLPNYVEGLLMIRTAGGNTMGLYFVDNDGAITLKNWGDSVSVSWQTNHIEISTGNSSLVYALYNLMP